MAFLEMRNITKKFPGVIANEDVNFSIEKGEIHALLGENGAGKSTLMNILYGLYQQTSGDVFLKGEKVNITNPRVAIELGIGMVHQHFMLIPALSVIENLVLGMKENKAVLDLDAEAKEVAELAARYNMTIDPYVKVWQLSVGQQQRLEIIKALYRGAELLILDEPTAVLTPQEVRDLFMMIRQLTSEGHTVIFITHKLAEVMEICDRCTVLRLGKLEATVNISDIHDKQELANLMVGKNVNLTVEKSTPKIGKKVLQVTGMQCKNNKGLQALKGVSLEIYAGEILGVAGVDGNGQSELVECLAGLRHIEQGHVMINDADCTNMNPRKILEKSVSHIPEDRHLMGMVSGMSVKENLMLMSYYKEPYSKGGFLNWKWVDNHASELCTEYNVKTPNINELAGKLSGGNQQKFVVAREMERQPDLLIAMHPARGLDIGATKYIQSRIVAERDRGAAVLLVSTELDEILELSDRIMVMYEGEIMGFIDGPYATREEVGMMMAGSHRNLERMGKTEQVSNLG